MKDQAWQLRELVPAYELFPKSDIPLKAKRIAVTSGKGGVGKTTVAINMGIILAAEGIKTLIIDGDVNLSNVPILTGTAPEFHFADVLQRRVNLMEIIYPFKNDLFILPSGLGTMDLVDQEEKFIDYMRREFMELDEIFDVILIDTASGISSLVLGEIFSADEVFVVTTPEPSAIGDAYAIVKVLTFFMPGLSVRLLFNWVKNEKQGKESFAKFNGITEKFLGREVRYLGALPFDENVRKAAMSQMPQCIQYPRSKFSRGLKQIMVNLIDSKNELMYEINVRKN